MCGVMLKNIYIIINELTLTGSTSDVRGPGVVRWLGGVRGPGVVERLGVVEGPGVVKGPGVVEGPGSVGLVVIRSGS